MYIPIKLPAGFMKSTYKIIWSDEALTNLNDTINYLENHWTEAEIKKFAQLLDKHLKLLQENPFLFPKSAQLSGLRKSVISKQNTIYYRIVRNNVHIITLFDNRQSPQKLKDK